MFHFYSHLDTPLLCVKKNAYGWKDGGPKSREGAKAEAAKFGRGHPHPSHIGAPWQLGRDTRKATKLALKLHAHFIQVAYNLLAPDTLLTFFIKSHQQDQAWGTAQPPPLLPLFHPSIQMAPHLPAIHHLAVSCLIGGFLFLACAACIPTH
eukprot:157536-Pelagomonas_calceolata.AAC.2